MGVRSHFVFAAVCRVCLLLALLACVPAARAQEEPIVTPTPDPKKKLPPLVWDAGVGFADYGAPIKAGYWYPVWIKMTAGELAIKGTVRLRQVTTQVMGEPQQSRLMVDVPVDIPPKTTKIYRSYYQITADEWQFIAPLGLQLQARDIPEEKLEVTFRPGPERPARHILVVGAERAGYGFLRVQTDTNNNVSPGGGPVQELIYGRPDFLPEDPVLLDSLDVIFIDAALAREITQAQWTAIETWTANGGVLVLGIGRHIAFAEQSVLRSPFGLKLPAATAEPLPADAKTLLDAARVEAPREILASPIDHAAAQWENVWAGDTHRPLIASKKIGGGSLLYCAAALDPWMLRLIDELDRRDYLLDKLAPRDRDAGATASPLRDLRNTNGQITALQEGFAVNLVGAGWVFLFLLAYNLLAMPFNWTICRRFGKPGLPWLILMFMAIGFAWFGYRSGVERQQQNFQINTLTLMRREVDAPLARSVALDTIYSPRRLRRDLATEQLAFPMPAGEGPAARQPFLMTFGAGAVVRDWLIHPWTVSNFRTEFAQPFEGQIVSAEPLIIASDGKIQGRLANNTEFAFQKWWLARGDQLVAQGTSPLEPQSSGTLALIEPEAASHSLTDNILLALSSSPLAVTAPEESLPSYNSPQDIESELRADISRQPLDEAKRRRLYQFLVGQGRREEAAVLMNELALLRALTSNSDRWWFIGLGSGGGLSPLASAFVNEVGNKRILYEQPVEVDSQFAALPTFGSSQIGWKITAHCNNVLLDTIRVGQKDPLPIPLNVVELYFEPERRLPIPPEMYVELTWRLDSYPLYEKIWRTPQPHKIAGCAASIFNFRTRAWEELGPWIGQATRFGPVADYLHPVENQLRLRLDATPENLMFVQKEVGIARENVDPVVTARQLFGNAINPTTSLDPYGQQMDGPPTCVAIFDAHIKIVPQPIAGQRREGAPR